MGLLGYVLMPTAPPRMFPEWGFSDTLAEHASVSHDSGLVVLRREPVRRDAEPPCDGRADRRHRDGLGLPNAVARILWLAWPAWVTFAVMGTGNHYWLDCAAGFLVALVVAAVLFRGRLRGVLTRAA